MILLTKKYFIYSQAMYIIFLGTDSGLEITSLNVKNDNHFVVPHRF